METLIRKLESFGPLPDGDKDVIARLDVTKRLVEPRTDLIAEGDSPADVHLITSGLACRCKLIEDGKRQIVAYLVPGDFCDLHVFILKAMDHNIATITRCEVVDIPRASILELLERPAISRSLMIATLVDEAVLREWVTNVGQRRAEQRVAHLFCELHARLRAVGLTQDGGFELPVTQAELADTVGLSIVHTNRSLQSLRQAGLITFMSGNLYIPDIGRLEKMSGFVPSYLHLSRYSDHNASLQ